MKETIEIQAVDLVRQIRDAQAAQLAEKSADQVMEFFNRAAERAKRRRGKTQAVAKSSKASDQRRRRAAEKTRRG
jgi:hypothetical protein